MIDFAVVSTPAEVEAPLKMIKLGSFQEILVGGTTFTALGSQTLSLKELHNYPLIGLGRETMTFQFFNRFFMSHGLEFAPDTETATTDQILPLVKSELGLAFMPNDGRGCDSKSRDCRDSSGGGDTAEKYMYGIRYSSPD